MSQNSDIPLFQLILLFIIKSKINPKRMRIVIIIYLAI